MSGWAVRNDGELYRAVDGPEEITDEEWYTEETPRDPVALPPTPEELLALANAERDRRLTVAAIRIAPLQDAADLGKTTPAKTALLKKWKEYRIDLDDVPDQEGFPGVIDWPVAPS